ncbi:DUF4238 domain-containing protein [Shimia thalassica]|uniref:DUF4238 domain-containing protein n=1 Tax=Shimia thalassica TaxID=1715693 RepID=UPI0027364CC4|nr:DUF4238 domain-containing protein [Shimia thalassica]MDP2579533.1 DUF4238 domain-containing protein [Shimia thalassica]
MSTPRRHHILPIAYQKQFMSRPQKIWVFDKKTEKLFETSPKNVSVRRDYNTALTNEKSLDYGSTEQFFGKNESNYPTTVSALRSGLQASSELDQAIQFMLLQAMRSPKARNLMGDLLLKFSPRGEDQLRSLGVEEAGIELLRRARAGDKDAEQKIGLQSSSHFARGLSSILAQLWYRPIRIESKLKLCSGDGPVLYFGVDKSRKKLRAGLPVASKRVLCCFPLADDLLLFGDSQKPPVSAFFTDQESQTTDSLALVKATNTAVSISSEQTVISGDEAALRKAIASSPKQLSPKLLFAHYSKLGTELLKLNRIRWNN